jgi:hypothetical protein
MSTISWPVFDLAGNRIGITYPPDIGIPADPANNDKWLKTEAGAFVWTVPALPTPADIGAAPASGIAPGAITGTAVVTGDARLSDARVPTEGSVTEGKIAYDAVTGLAIRDGTITSANIADGTITSAKVNGSIATSVDLAFVYNQLNTRLNAHGI